MEERRKYQQRNQYGKCKIEKVCLICNSQYFTYNYIQKYCSSKCYHNSCIGKTTSLKGKTLEDIHGVKKSDEIKSKIKQAVKEGKCGFKTRHKVFGGFEYRFKKGYNPSSKSVIKRSITLKTRGSLKGENNPMFGRKGELHPNYGKVWTEKQRIIMKKVRLQQIFPNKDTTPEQLLQQELTNRNIIFTKHKLITNIDNSYQCDIFIEPNIVIEVDGDYWHNYPYGTWKDKIRTDEMRKKSYIVIRFWEREIKANTSTCIDFVQNMMNSGGNKCGNYTSNYI